jgi:hypothetical protein
MVRESGDYKAFAGDALSHARMRSDIFQFPFRLNPGTIEESVGTSVDLL